MKKLLIIFALLFGFAFSFAQSNAPKALLDKVSNHYKNLDNFYLEFESTLDNSDKNIKDSYSGKVYVADEKFNLSIPQMNLVQIYNGDKLHTIYTDQKEVNVTTVSADSEELYSPTRLFNMYKSGYNLSFGDKKTINNQSVQFVKLTPTGKSNISYALIGVNPKTLDLVQLLEVSKNKSTTTINITKQQNGIIIPSSVLKFNKKFYKDYYISEF